MRGGRRQLASRLQLVRQRLLHLNTTLVTTSDIRQAIHGHRPTQDKILSLGEYVFLTDITFMFTHSFQLLVLILFHCTIHASLFSFLSLLLVCLKNLKKNQKKLVVAFSQFTFHACSSKLKIKPKKIYRSSFACLELSRVNSFALFLSFGGREDYIENAQWLLYARSFI